MIRLPFKNLFSEKTRFFASVGGVAFSILLIIILLGVYQGFSILAKAYIINLNTEIVVGQEGIKDMSHSFSTLPEKMRGRIQSLTSGEVYSLVTQTTEVKVRELDNSKMLDFPGRKKNQKDKGFRKETLKIIGFDTKSGVGGPWKMKEGLANPGPREIVVDEVFARKSGLGIGDSLEALGKIFKIVGLSREGNMMIYQLGFVDINDLQEIQNSRGTVNFFLVKVPSGKDAEALADKLNENIDGISAFKREDFAQSNAKMLTESFIPIIIVLSIIGFLTGAVVVGLTIYTATMEKSREYGVIKAIGASNSFLFKLVFEQSLISSIVGYFVGILLSVVVTFIATSAVPMMTITFAPWIFLLSFFAAILMSLLAAYVPVRRISKLDPASVFKQ